jgi:ATP-dependent RNA helicase SUPV3L1/SUV3
VAFSVQDVYALAEQIRARHGGTAVVLGALSPRTRNAQVAMYQAGEVQHMVATDAIGMGLNMDVDRIVFAARHKFDGKEIRPLETAELAQIAGRAGRFTRDGSFGTLNSVPALSPDAVASIENHAFVPVRRIVWRNSALEFSSLDALIGSLRERPRRRCLQLVEQADDFDALVALARMQNVRDRATTPAAIELLWDVCRIPDFRKLLLDTHVQLLAAVFNQLVGPRRRVDEDWMARRIARLDDTEGDIETLMNRIAFIRTWTYITNHERWVPNAEHWQAVTRDVEDRQSEALHQRLTERFVESRSSIAIGRPAGGRRRRRTGRTPTVTVDPDSPFSALADLDVPDPVHEHHDDFAHWVEEIVEASFGAFELRDDGWIHHGERRLARLTRGPDVLHPEVTLVGDSSLGPGAQSRVARRLVAWSRDAVASLLAPLSDLARADVSASVRGIAYQLERGLGSVDAAPAAAQLRALTPDDRQRLEATGVVVGQGAVYLPASLRFEAMRLRGALWAAYFGHEPAPAVPPPGTVSVKVSRSVSVAFWSHIGFVIRGPLAIRADQLERAQAWLRDNAGPEGPLVPPQLGAWLGCRRRQLPSVLRAMGFQLDRDGRPSPSGRSGSNQRRSGPPSSRTREPGGVGSRR